jgi:hypothetical protein
MNSYEHILFVLNLATDKDAIEKSELGRYLGRLSNILAMVEGDNRDAEQLSLEIDRRFEAIVHPSWPPGTAPKSSSRTSWSGSLPIAHGGTSRAGADAECSLPTCLPDAHRTCRRRSACGWSMAARVRWGWRVMGARYAISAAPGAIR